MQHYTRRLRQLPLELLPNKRRRAIIVGQKIVTRQLQLIPHTDKALRDLLRMVAGLSKLTSEFQEEDSVIDAYQLSQQWLMLLQPKLLACRASTRRKLITLADLPAVTPAIVFTEIELRQFEAGLITIENKPPDVAACILGVPGKKGEALL